jgi:hypothetical protein
VLESRAEILQERERYARMSSSEVQDWLPWEFHQV